MEESDQEKYERLLRESHYGIPKPNYQQADPFNVPVNGAPAGYTLRDLMGSPKL